MVKLNDLEVQEPRAPRLDLKDLKPEMELKATGEKFMQATTMQIVDENTHQTRTVRKSAGLNIVFETREGLTFPQKYSKMSATVLKEAMKKLKLGATEDLQKNWFLYIKTPMEMGNDRMIPIKKVE